MCPKNEAFCEQHGLEYVVFKRKPKEGLPRRESTHLRGFYFMEIKVFDLPDNHF
jgi:hypothetical protein